MVKLYKGKEKGRIHTEVRVDAKRKKRRERWRFICIRSDLTWQNQKCDSNSSVTLYVSDFDKAAIAMCGDLGKCASCGHSCQDVGIGKS